MSKQDRERLVERLRGRYAVGEGDPPEFGVRKFPVIPIQEEAADEIEQLRAENARLREIAECNDPGAVKEIGDERDEFERWVRDELRPEQPTMFLEWHGGMHVEGTAHLMYLAFKGGKQARDLERRLAYREARCSIESYCKRYYGGWYDITTPEPGTADELDEAVRYLEWRGLLERWENAPHIVRVKEES